MKNKKAFTMIELVFVIVILGIVGSLITKVIKEIYVKYRVSETVLQMHSVTENIALSIEKRLSFREKASLIVKYNSNCYNLYGDDNNISYVDKDFVLEWVGLDGDGFRGVWDGGFFKPTWSGFVDVNSSDTNNSQLKTLGTDTSLANDYIKALSNDGADFNDSAIVFIDQANMGNPCKNFGFNYDIRNLSASEKNIHSVASTATSDVISGDFEGMKIYEFYKLAWTAYAIEHNSTTNELRLYSNYQPWKNEKYTSAKSNQLLANDIESVVVDMNTTNTALTEVVRMTINMTRKIIDTNKTVTKEIQVY